MKLLMKPWPQCRNISLAILAVLMFAGTPLAFADDDLGVTMRMVTDEDVTRSVTREIPLPPTVPESGPENPGNDRGGEGPGTRGPESRGPAGGPPGLQGPAGDRDAERGRPSGHPGGPRDRVPGKGRPDNPGRGNRPDKH